MVTESNEAVEVPEKNVSVMDEWWRGVVWMDGVLERKLE
jgi:hypothetical protein